MTEFFSFLKVFVMCTTVFFIATTVLLALPQSKLRSVGLEMSRWALMCGLLLLVPSPVDVLPDVVPGLGMFDDICYLVAAVFAGKSAWKERNRRSALDDWEFEQTMAAKRRAAADSPEGTDDEREAA